LKNVVTVGSTDEFILIIDGVVYLRAVLKDYSTVAIPALVTKLVHGGKSNSLRPSRNGLFGK
jgi:hypothetical protein